MKKPLVLFTLLYASSSGASPQLSACMFEAKLIDKPAKIDGSIYRLKGEPKAVSKFEHSLFVFSDHLCPVLNVPLKIEIEISSNEKKALEKVSEANAIDVVIEEVEGFYDGSNVHTWRTTKLADPRHYKKVNKPM